jgi:uncharacterized protein YqfB (UPF0267 family)
MLGKIIETGQDTIYIKLESNSNFKLNQPVEVKEHRKKRSLPQNKLYWSFLEWCISSEGGDLISQGHWSKDALHMDIKSWIQSEYPNQFDYKELFSSAALDTKQFTDFIELVDRELMVKFFEIDTSKFWGEVEDKPLPF